MARAVLTVAGAAVGFFIGGPAGAAMGAQIGGLIGGIVDPQVIRGPRLSDLKVTASTYGAPIPLLYGSRVRISGNVIWSTGLIESKSRSSGGKGGPQVEEYSYRMSLAIALGQGEIAGIRRIWANSKLLFDIDELAEPPPPPTPEVGMVVVADVTETGGILGEILPEFFGRQEGGPYSVLRVYQGNGTQEVDPTIEAYEGAGNAPAYRHTAYLVISDLQLADYGNAMPNIEVEVVPQESVTVGTVVRDICSRAGIEDVSTSALQQELRGYVVAQSGPAWQAIEPLTRSYHFDVAEQYGQLRCVRRGGGLRGVIPIEDMGAHDATAGAGRVEPIRHETLSDLRMPQEVAVSYSDPNMDYQVNTQRASRAAGLSENNIATEIPLVLTADEARRIADRLLWEAWTARRSARFAVSDRWIGVQPGDVLGVPVAGEVIAHRIQRLLRGHDGVIEIEAAYEDPEVYASTAAGAGANIPANPIHLPGTTRLVLLDAPILREQDDNAGFYWVASGEQMGWRGAQILRSVDGGDTYDVMSPVAVRAVIGDVASALPPGPAHIWDRGNELTVVLHYAQDQLESRSMINVLAGVNAAWLGPANGQGGEVIQFATAELVAPATYVLRDLLRGRLGTEHAIATHGPDEVFVLLQAGPLGRSDYGVGDWGHLRTYLPVTNFTAQDDATPQTFENTGEAKRPLSPVHVTGERDDGGDLTIRWVRRTRLPVPGLGRGPVPLGEEAEAYEVDVLLGAQVVRTIAASSTSVIYTAAQQTADGITPGDPVVVVVYQLSASRGRGHGGARRI